MGFPIERIRVGTSPLTGTVYIGRVDTSGTRWLEKRECNDEALEAVRDHLVCRMEKYNEEAEKEDPKTGYFGYEWVTRDGRTVTLRVTVTGKTNEDWHGSTD